ncbi:MAG: 4Fe-4S binding protein, partial [Proteobacteria bacterium]|nr:4Fe-4S binding protein [Pseudomonadota bacterium]
MIRFLRALRLTMRISMVGILLLTAAAALQYIPSHTIVSKADQTLAPPRQAPEGFVQYLNRYLSGGPASVSIFDMEILDPALGLISALSVPDSISPVALAVLIPVLLTICLGRVFCGYLCPVGWIASTLASLRRRLKRPAPKYNLSTAGYILLTSIACLAIAGLPSAVSLSLVHLNLQQLAIYTIEPSVQWTAAGVIIAFLVFDLFIAPGSWCRFLCPSGVIYALLSRKRLLRVLKTDSKKCPSNCHSCNEHCWLHLTPRSHDPGIYCDMCLTCVKACPYERLNIGRARKRYKKKRMLLVLIAAIAMIATITFPASGRSQTNDKLPMLDANPPWSNSINRLDYETWIKKGKLHAGLSISLVERTELSDLYIFSAALTSSDPKILKSGSVEFVVISDQRKASLQVVGPNAPRSTVNRVVYSGRTFVDADACSTLTATFPAHDLSLEVVFPSHCRISRISHLFYGFFTWGGLLAIL